MYLIHRAVETERVKGYRASMSEDTKARYRERSRIRMKRYRERQKRQQKQTPRVQTKTRTGQDRQRELWKEQKKRQREKLSQQKKRWINEKRREAYKKKRTGQGNRGLVEGDLSDQENQVTHTYKPSAKAKAVARAIAILPKDPDKYTQVVAGLVKRSSPKKRKAIMDQCQPSPKRTKFMKDTVENLKTTLQSIKRKRDKKSNQRRRVISSSIGMKNKYRAHYEFGFSWTYLMKCSQLPVEGGQKKRSDAVNIETVTSIEKFYKRGDISRVLPDKKYITKKGMKNRHVMERSLKSAYLKFREEHPTLNISFSKFVKLRPRNIKTMAHNKLIQCCCEYCVNIELKLRTINKTAILYKKNECCIRDKYEASRLTLCPKRGEHYQKSCLQRECRQCGVKKVDEKLKPLNHVRNSVVNWGKWENVTKEKNGSSVSRKTLVNKTDKFSSLVQELKQEISPFARHLFVAQWQIKQYDMLKESVPPNSCLAVMDFGENYTCTFQDEAQSAHWAYTQVTLHPIVCFFPCAHEGCTEMSRHSVIIVSNDLKHDFHAVHCYVQKVLEFLKQEEIPIKKFIIFSDGAPTQYKNKSSFCDCSFAYQDFKCHIERHYFGSRHGKGPCDAEVGVIKRCASLAVNARQVVIGNSQDLYEYCQGNLSGSEGHNHTKRSFLYVSSESINRERLERVNVAAVKDTRSMHCVVGLSPYKVKTKELSCFCKACTKGKGSCVNKVHTGTFKHVSIKKTTVLKGTHSYNT